MTKEQKELCEMVEKETGGIVELSNIIENDNKFDTVDKLIERCEELIYQHEVIGYYNAMQYLSENDMSLRDSIELAVEYGMSIENLTSETFATLLQQRDALESLYEYRDKIDDLFYSVI